MCKVFSCGAEEPLHPNEQLYAVDEQSVTIELARFASARLRRYSFVAQDYSATEADALPLVARIASAVAGEARWLVAFQKVRAESIIRPRALVARLTNRQWKLTEGADVYVATKSVSLDSARSLAPSDADLLICGWAILLGQTPDELLVDGPCKETVRMLAWTHRLQPSPEFLATCGDAECSVVYLAKGPGGRFGFIVVTASDLSPMIQAMRRDGLVDRVLLGPDAHRVWTG
jgi:hypothetical protein